MKPPADNSALSEPLVEDVRCEDELDNLTGLYTENAFSSRVDKYISGLTGDQSYTLIFIDMDNYLLLCNKKGIARGQELLKKVSVTIKAMFSNSGPASRIHRDEFAVFIERAPDEEILNEQLRILCRALHYDMGDEDGVIISASLGVITGNDPELRYEVLSGYGEVAVHNAKRLGGNTYSYYSTAIEKDFFESTPSGAAALSQKTESAGNEQKPRVFARAFGYFEVFLDDEPIDFTSKKAKELFALMIDRKGGFVGASEAITYLWDDAANDKTVFARYRKVAMRLKEILQSYGILDIMENSGGYRRIISEKIGCDYYNYLSGDAKFKDLFRGSYMTNYSWGEETLAELWSTYNYDMEHGE